jgi:hypothetical protein
VRRIPLSYRSHVTGFQGLPSGAIDYESALERDFVLLTLFDDPSARIRSQPVTLNFEHEGRHRRYTPDYLIEGGGRFELIEIKYEADLQRLQTHLEPGFNIAREWAARSGGVFRVVTERAIRVPRLLNAAVCCHCAAPRSTWNSPALSQPPPDKSRRQPSGRSWRQSMATGRGFSARFGG